jgi:hypothetical protein
LRTMSIPTTIAAVAAMLLLATCAPETQYFAPQLPWVPPDADPAAINSVGYAVRPALPGRPSYLETIKYIDDGLRYIDPYAQFFVSVDGQLCFRGLVNRELTLFENYQNYWCMQPTAVNNVDALENDISYVNSVRLWCVLEAPQCARRFGWPNFLDESGWIGNSITVQTRPFREQRNAIEYLIYLMGGPAQGGAPLRLLPPNLTRTAG